VRACVLRVLAICACRVFVFFVPFVLCCVLCVCRVCAYVCQQEVGLECKACNACAGDCHQLLHTRLGSTRETAKRIRSGGEGVAGKGRQRRGGDERNGGEGVAGWMAGKGRCVCWKGHANTQGMLSHTVLVNRASKTAPRPGVPSMCSSSHTRQPIRACCFLSTMRCIRARAYPAEVNYSTVARCGRLWAAMDGSTTLIPTFSIVHTSSLPPVLGVTVSGWP